MPATAKAEPDKKPRTRRKPARKQSGAKPDVDADGNVVFVVGANTRADQVRDMIRRLGLECRHESRPLSALERLDDKIGLVLIVPPLPSLSAVEFCRRLAEHPDGAGLPLIVVGSSRREARRLYQFGIAGQFHWPGERVALIRAVIRIVGTASGAGNRNVRDAALASKVEERLKAERATFGSLLTVQVQRGVVMLEGEVDSLWKISEVERLLSQIPGVQEVVTSRVRVSFGGVADGVIGRSVRSVLRGALGEDHDAFAIHVSNGQVVLTGTAANRRELKRVVGLIEQVNGVRVIENLAAIAPQSASGSAGSARSLTRLIHRQFPGSRVEIAIFGKVAVLGGTARNASERRAIEQLAADHPHIDSVISKIG